MIFLRSKLHDIHVGRARRKRCPVPPFPTTATILLIATMLSGAPAFSETCIRQSGLPIEEGNSPIYQLCATSSDFAAKYSTLPLVATSTNEELTLTIAESWKLIDLSRKNFQARASDITGDTIRISSSSKEPLSRDLVPLLDPLAKLHVALSYLNATRDLSKLAFKYFDQTIGSSRDPQTNTAYAEYKKRQTDLEAWLKDEYAQLAMQQKKLGSPLTVKMIKHFADSTQFTQASGEPGMTFQSHVLEVEKRFQKLARSTLSAITSNNSQRTTLLLNNYEWMLLQSRLDLMSQVKSAQELTIANSAMDRLHAAFSEILLRAYLGQNPNLSNSLFMQPSPRHASKRLDCNFLKVNDPDMHMPMQFNPPGNQNPIVINTQSNGQGGGGNTANQQNNGQNNNQGPNQNNHAFTQQGQQQPIRQEEQPPPGGVTNQPKKAESTEGSTDTLLRPAATFKLTTEFVQKRDASLRLGEESTQMLKRPDISQRLPPEVKELLQSEIKRIESVLRTAESSFSNSLMTTRRAHETIINTTHAAAQLIHNFLRGVADGSIKNVKSTAEALKLMTKNFPETWSKLTNGIMHQLSEDPKAFLPNFVESYAQLQDIIQNRTPYEQGVALGAFATNLLILAIPGGVLEQAALSTIQISLIKSPLMGQMLGKSILEAAERIPSVSPALKATKQSIAKLGAATTKASLEALKRVGTASGDFLQSGLLLDARGTILLGKELVERGAFFEDGFKSVITSARKINRVSANELNAARAAAGQAPPWISGRKVLQVVLDKPTSVWRVHADIQGQLRVWVTHFDPRNYTKEQLAQLLALPGGPSNINMVTELKVPSGTTLRGGFAGPNEYGPGGLFQWEIVGKVDKSWVVGKAKPF